MSAAKTGYISSYLVLLMLQLVWHGWPFPNSTITWFWLLLSTLPLVVMTPWLLQLNKNRITIISWLILLYFCHATMEAYSSTNQTWLAYIELMLTITNFSIGVLLIRKID